MIVILNICIRISIYVLNLINDSITVCILLVYRRSVHVRTCTCTCNDMIVSNTECLY